jgi:hypothetical protein
MTKGPLLQRVEVLLLRTILGGALLCHTGCSREEPHDENPALTVLVTQWTTESEQGVVIDVESATSCVSERIESCTLRTCDGAAPTAGAIIIGDGSRGMPIILRPEGGIYPRFVTAFTFEPNIDFDVHAEGADLPPFRVRTSFPSVQGLSSTIVPTRIPQSDSLRITGLEPNHELVIESTTGDFRAVCEISNGGLEISARALDRMFESRTINVGVYTRRTSEATLEGEVFVVETRNGIRATLVRE